MDSQISVESRKKKRRHTEEQIVAILREAEAGMATPELCRKHGIGEPTFFRWKANFQGLDASQVQLLRLKPAAVSPSPQENRIKKRRHTEEQIVAILKEAEAGMPTPELCSKHGISEMTFFQWKANYRGLDARQVRRLRLRRAIASRNSDGGRMKIGRHTEEQIAAILNEADAGMATPELCNKHGISQPTFFRWKAKHRDVDTDRPQLLRQGPMMESECSDKSRMKKRRHTEEEIVAILKEAESGLATPELCIKHGIGEPAFFRWKANFQGLDVNQVRLLRLRPTTASQSSEESSIKNRRHTEEEIVTILKEAEEGMATPELRSKYGISEMTFFRWKAKYRGLDASQVRMLRLRPAEMWKRLNEENYKLRQLVTELVQELDDSRARLVDQL